MSKDTSYRASASSAEKNGGTVDTGDVTAAHVATTGANAAAHAEGVAFSDI